jgi:hypothetical protein
MTDPIHTPPGQRKRRVLILGVTAAVATFAGAGLTWWIYAGKPSDEWRKDARYLPDDCHVVATVRVDEFLASQAGKEVIEQVVRLGQNAQSTFERVAAEVSGKPAPPPPPKLEPREAFIKDVRAAIGVDPFDIVHLTVGQAEGDHQPVFIVRTRKVIKAEEIQEHLPNNVFQFIGQAPQPPVRRSTKVGNHTVHEAAGVSFVIPEDRVIVYGSTGALRAILERTGAARMSAELTEALAHTDCGKTLAVAVVPPKGKQAFIPEGFNSPIPDSASLTLDVTDRVKITGRLKFANSGQAGECKTAVDGILGKAREGSGIPPGVTKLVGSIHVKQSGDQVLLTASADAAAIIDVIAQLGTRAERTFKQVGEKVGAAVDPNFKPVGDGANTFKKVGKAIDPPKKDD